MINPKLEILNPKQTLNYNYSNFQTARFGIWGFGICDLFRIFPSLAYFKAGFRLSGTSLVFSVLTVCLFLNGCSEKPLYKDTRIALGTYVEVTSPDQRSPKIVFDELRRIENLLSKYNADSEVSRLNQSGKSKVSPETFYVISRAKEFWQSSNGAFDITVAPLLEIWGFKDKQFRLPKDNEIKEALKRVGSDKIILHSNEFVIEFNTPGVQVDLGAIAKGFAVDCAVRKLKEAGVKSCLINAGGDIYCLGNKSGSAWRVGIQDSQGSGVLEYLKLSDSAVATSGDYEQYFDLEGKRYSHIFDPRTGYPASSGVHSVTVIATDCLTADSLATAVFVLGKGSGERLAKKYPGVKIKFDHE